MIKSVSAQILKEWLAKNEAILVDVREPSEYQAGHIDGATLLPLGSITNGKLPDLEGRRLVLQCRVGGRSQMACMKLIVENPEQEVYNLEGGIEAWKQAGY